MELREYVAADGSSPFKVWFDALAAQAAAKLAVALARMEAGDLSNAKSVGAGVQEYRVDAGPGYRFYFGHDGDALIILLAGGTKRRQQKDIDAAQARWAEYKRRKRGA